MIQCPSLLVVFVANATDLAVYDPIVVQSEWQTTSDIVEITLPNKWFSLTSLLIYQQIWKYLLRRNYKYEGILLVFFSLWVSVLILWLIGDSY